MVGPAGRRRSRAVRARPESPLAIAAFVAAIVAGGVLLFAPVPRPGPSSAPGPTASAAAPIPLAQAWPDAKPSSYRGGLPDGTQFSPTLHIDQDTVVGTAPTPDRRVLRMLLRKAGRVTEVRRLAAELIPQFAGFTESRGTLVWAETTRPPGATDGVTRLWRLDWRRNGRPVLMTSDTGNVLFHQTEHDLVVADGQVHWAAAELVSRITVTQVRSVRLTGGKVSVRRERGTFVLSEWPWLVSPFSGRAAPTRLVNLTTGEKITVGNTPGELTRCTPTWCRVGITGDAGLIRTDLKRPDGSQRRRIAGADASPILNDVALLDRFEVLVALTEPLAGPSAPPTPGGDRLELYEIPTGRTVILDAGIATALSHGGMLWWSKGSHEALTWHALDLASLT